MELRATTLGKRMAQHPYDRVQLLNAGVKVSGDSHEYLIPFNQLLSIHCKRGLVWGELEFTLPGEKVVRLHGTEWSETQRFYHHLNTLWQQWSAEMSDIAADVLRQQLAEVARSSAEGKWLTRQQVSDIQRKIRHALSGLPVPTVRLDAFDNCRELWRQCQSWLSNTEKARLEHNQTFTESMLEQYRGFFAAVESSPLNPAQARAVVNGERSLLVLAGAGSGKTSVLVARAGWLLTRGEAAAEQILLLAFGRQAAQEMDERIRERLGTEEISARTFHSLALHIIQQGSKKAPTISKLESDSAARQKLLVQSWQQQCQEKKAQAKGWRLWVPVTIRAGRFGPYIQLGEPTEEEPKPKRASIPKSIAPDAVDLPKAMQLLSLPRTIGDHPEGGVITAAIGPYGPYILWTKPVEEKNRKTSKTYVNIPEGDEIFTIGMNRAVEMIANKPPGRGRGQAAEPIRALGAHPDGGDMAIMKGRYGPYIKWEKVNATIPKGTEPEDVTMDMAIELVNAKAATKGKRKAPAKKKPAAKKPVAKKKTPAKKAAAKK